MKTITFNEEKFTFKTGEFTDLDCWYEEKINELADQKENGEITNSVYLSLFNTLRKLYDEVFEAI